jgi:outer membrane receptor protein involved in Fe transport
LASTLAIVPLHSAIAQEQAQGDQVLEEVVVTGSRIVRQDFTANSPIQTVDETLFDETSAIGVETVLNRLPQFVPAVTQFTTGDVQQTATNTVGASTVSLRGLGANRNLVLINGRRAMPVDPTMVVDTNSIPSAAIRRVEIISGGASAVYGADAVGGVVNFILKDNYEGATVDVRFGDTQHGGNQTVTVSALLGANVADDRGNVMMGIERDTRTKQLQWQRDWRLQDFANPRTGGGGFAFGSATYFTNPPVQTPSGATNNHPSATVVNDIFSQRAPGSTISNRISPNFGAGTSTTNFRVNDDGTLFTGLTGGNTNQGGSYRFTGPVYNGQEFCNAAAGVACRNQNGGGDLDGDLQGLPVFVRQPNGTIKENNLYSWASIPLERLSAFANGHFDVTDDIRVTGMATITRTKTETSLGLAAANINQWGAGIPFGNDIYRGQPNNTYVNIPDSLIDVNGNGVADAGDQTNPAYTPGGRFGVQCEGPATAAMPWLDNLPGCTDSEAWPTSPEVYRLMQSRPRPNEDIWLSREPDWLRSSLGAGRSTDNTTTTMSFTLGVEGELPSGDHTWDASIYTGRADNLVNQLGSMRLTSYRDVLASPNFGRNAIFDPNPWEWGGFAEIDSSCTSGLPVMTRFKASADCLQMVAPSLKNTREMTQTVFEANLVGDLAEMRAGPLSYALGTTYRENSFEYTPDNLSLNQNQVDPIAGLWPNEPSSGEFDVSEIYGELLIPIISDGPLGVEHFNLELGARVSDWSMEQMPNLNTYKALIDWAVTPRYRIRGGFNRAFRAPNLGELYISRTTVFSGSGGTRDWCSQNLDSPVSAAGTFSATPVDYDRDDPNDPADSFYAGTPTAQTQQTLNLCRQLMGPTGAALYYDSEPINEQPAVGGVGTPQSFGNPALREEQADTYTIGVAMDILEDWRLTVDWWQIEIENMIALEGGDTIYRRCLELSFNPTGDINNEACRLIHRNTGSGGAGSLDRQFTNEGLAKFSGVDVALNWSRQLDGGGALNLNATATVPVHEITQDRKEVAPIERQGYDTCALQLQCANYDYRLFTTVGYGRGQWNTSVRHQYWPDLPNNACRNTPTANACINSSLPAYGLFSASGNIRFDRYTVSIGIENLLDEEPPCLGANPANAGFALECSRTSPGSVYDPLGRQYYVSMSMEF